MALAAEMNLYNEYIKEIEERVNNNFNELKRKMMCDDMRVV